MKKLVTLLLAAGLVFSAANRASAVEVNTFGLWHFTFNGVSNNDFLETKDRADKKHETKFGAAQRLRIGMDFIVSENLSATYILQVGEFEWGGSNAMTDAAGNVAAGETSGGALGTRANNLSTREAYLDWTVPNTSVKVRMGQQMFGTPGYAFRTPVANNIVGTGVQVFAPVTDMVDVTAGWIRARSDGKAGSLDNKRDHGVADLFLLKANVQGDGFKVTPWTLLGPVGAGTLAAQINDKGVKNPGPKAFTGFSNGATNIDDGFLWFAGISGSLTMFDPFRFAADFYYSGLSADGIDGHNDYKASGWYAALAAEYATAYGTGALRGWYASGDDKDDYEDNKSHQALSLLGGFNASTSYFDGRWGLGTSIDRNYASGTWGVGLYWSGLSFVQNLKHDFGVVYFQGTNDKDSGYANKDLKYLTTKDSAVEVDFTTTYQIYENLATALELSYIFQDFDKDVHGVSDFSDNFRATLNFKYTF